MREQSALFIPELRDCYSLPEFSEDLKTQRFTTQHWQHNMKTRRFVKLPRDRRRPAGIQKTNTFKGLIFQASTILFFLTTLPPNTHAQPTAPNESTQLERDTVNETWRFKWWGQQGRT